VTKRATSKRKKKTSAALAGTLSAFDQEQDQSVKVAETALAETALAETVRAETALAESTATLETVLPEDQETGKKVDRETEPTQRTGVKHPYLRKRKKASPGKLKDNKLAAKPEKTENKPDGQSSTPEIVEALPPTALVGEMITEKAPLDNQPDVESIPPPPTARRKRPGIIARIFQSLRFKRRKKTFARQFAEWIVAQAEQSDQKFDFWAMDAWLAGLPDREVEDFRQQVSLFCADLNVELDWLGSVQLSKDSPLQQLLEDVVARYCLVRWQVSQIQGDIKAFGTFLVWQEHPSRSEYHEFNQKLFARLVEKGLAVQPQSDLLVASEKDRQTYAVQAIQQAAGQDRQMFNMILKEVVTNATSLPLPTSFSEAGEEKE
jgi:hypothetical protein